MSAKDSDALLADALFDIRLLDRNIRKSLLTRKDLEKHLKSLPDVADRAAARPEGPDAIRNRSKDG